MIDVSFVIPANNEELNLELLLKAIEQESQGWDFAYEVIVVDDHSVDKTYDLVLNLSKNNERIKVIKNDRGAKGMGVALLAGSYKAQGKYICWLMADLSDDLSLIRCMCDKLEQGMDMVFASRYMAGGSSGDLERWKAFLSGAFTKMARIWFGFNVHDITNAYRMFRRQLLNEVTLTSIGFSISPEFAIKSHLYGAKLDELPALYKRRTKGQAKFKLMKVFFSYTRLFLLRFKHE